MSKKGNRQSLSLRVIEFMKRRMLISFILCIYLCLSSCSNEEVKDQTDINEELVLDTYSDYAMQILDKQAELDAVILSLNNSGLMSPQSFYTTESVKNIINIASEYKLVAENHTRFTEGYITNGKERIESLDVPDKYKEEGFEFYDDQQEVFEIAKMAAKQHEKYAHAIIEVYDFVHKNRDTWEINTKDGRIKVNDKETFDQYLVLNERVRLEANELKNFNDEILQALMVMEE